MLYPKKMSPHFFQKKGGSISWNTVIINPKKFLIDNILDMKYMFYECFSINNREKVYLFFQKRLKELGITRRVFFGYEMVIELNK